LQTHNRADEIFLCPDCREREFERADDQQTSECGCLTNFRGMALCAHHALIQKRCKACGADLTEADDTAHRLAVRAKRKRELKKAVKEREPLKENERDQQRRDKKDNGCTKKVRQRHRLPR